MSGDIFGCHNWGVCVCVRVCTESAQKCDRKWVKARDAAKAPTMHRVVSTVKNDLDQNVTSADSGKPLTCFSTNNLPVADT